MSLDAELQRITRDDKPRDAAQFIAGAKANVASWEQDRQLDTPATEWALLHAYVARIDCDADFSSPDHAERLAFAESTLNRLLYRDGEGYAMAHPHRRTLVSRFKPMVLLGHGGSIREPRE